MQTSPKEQTKQSSEMSKKNIETFGNTTRRITMPKKITIKNPEDKKKQLSATIDYLNRASCTGKNLQKNKKIQMWAIWQKQTTK